MQMNLRGELEINFLPLKTKLSSVKLNTIRNFILSLFHKLLTMVEQQPGGSEEAETLVKSCRKPPPVLDTFSAPRDNSWWHQTDDAAFVIESSKNMSSDRAMRHPSINLLATKPTAAPQNRKKHCHNCIPFFEKPVNLSLHQWALKSP